jgi:hypothetical protein
MHQLCPNQWCVVDCPAQIENTSIVIPFANGVFALAERELCISASHQPCNQDSQRNSHPL